MKTFGGIPQDLGQIDNANIILQSIPYDGTSTWGKGADDGFEAFLEAAENMELYDIETNFEVYKKGIFMPEAWTGFSTPVSMFQKTYSATKDLLKSGKFLTFFGGEHSVSIGVIKAHYEHFENLTVVQLDAHADLRSSYEGSAYNHACAVYDASKNCNLIQVGIRSMDVSEKDNMDFYKTFFGEEIKNVGDAWMQQSIDLMTEDIYITLDLDVLDPAIMPSTGTPEPNGMDWHSITRYLKLIFETKNVVGFDIVELAPIPGLHAPNFLAAKLYYKMLSYKFCKS